MKKKYIDYSEYIKCPVCSGDDLKDYFQIEYKKLRQKQNLDYSNLGIYPDTVLSTVKCRKCGFVFVNPRVKKKHEHLVYGESKSNKYTEGGAYHKTNEKFYNQVRNSRLDSFPVLMEAIKKLNHSYTTSVPVLFDYGCGFGHSMSIAKVLGIDAYGVDIDQKRLELCKSQGLKVCEPLKFDLLYPDVKADIILWESNIEHLVDLNAGTKFIQKLCKKGTVLYVNGLTPAEINIERLKNDFNIAHFVEHVNYFPIKTLDKFMVNYVFKPLGMKRVEVLDGIIGINGLLKYIVRLILDFSLWEKFSYTFRGNFARFYRYH